MRTSMGCTAGGAAIGSLALLMCLATTVPVRGDVVPQLRDSSVQLWGWQVGIPSLLTTIGSTSTYNNFDIVYSPGTSQHSSVSTSGASYSGSTFAESNSAGTSGGFSVSSFRYTFKVTTRIRVQVDASLQATNSANAELRLYRSGQTFQPLLLATGNTSPPFDPNEVHWTGTLTPQTYTISINEGGKERVVAPPGTNTACSATVTFSELFCAGDFNYDGFVNDQDFVGFVVAYNLTLCSATGMPAGCPADINQDGFVDDADFVIFAASYDELVCP